MQSVMVVQLSEDKDPVVSSIVFTQIPVLKF